LEVYNPNNNWRRKLENVNVEEIIILGLASKPNCVRLKGHKQGLGFDWENGVAARDAKKKGGIGKKSSKLTIKQAGASIISDWEIEIELGGKVCETQQVSKSPLQSVDCPVGQFKCENKGHVSSCLLISRVNDGICDPECCDGSDETDGKVNCPDECERIGEEYRKAKEEEDRKWRVGSQIREGYIRDGKYHRANLRANWKAHQSAFDMWKMKEEEARKEVERLEAESDEQTKILMGTQLYKRMHDHLDAISGLREQKRNLEQEVEKLSSILSDLSVGKSRHTIHPF
jgi:mannosyl-oligosaccharide alpha-1,3-glucosidase